MKYNVRKNWMESFGFIKKNPIVLIPFIMIAFFETLALEFLYFSSRFPISAVANPIIKKFFGETFIHYPGNLVLLPRLFYYKQIGIYIIFGVLLTAISANIFKNIKEGLPVRLNAMVKNGLARYGALLSYAIVVMVLIVLIQNVDNFIFGKAARLLSRISPKVLPQTFYSLAFSLFLFFTNVILQAFVVLTIPYIVIEKRPFLKALFGSVVTGAKNFLSVFTLVLLPFLVYLPLTLLKSFSMVIVDKTIPEMNLIITLVGIVITIFLDCFIIVCASQFVLDKSVKK